MEFDNAKYVLSEYAQGRQNVDLIFVAQSACEELGIPHRGAQETLDAFMLRILIAYNLNKG